MGDDENEPLMGEKKAEKFLRAIGILVEFEYEGSEKTCYAVIAETHPELKNLMRGTQWASSWADIISRLPGAERIPASVERKFSTRSGQQTRTLSYRAVRVPLDADRWELQGDALVGD